MSDMKARDDYYDYDGRDVGCCGMFWGPFRPLVGGHTLGEAATSSLLPIFIVLLYRMTFTIFMGSTFVYYYLRGQYELLYFTIWSHLGLAITFAFLSALSMLYMCAPHNTRSTRPNVLASFGVLLFQVFASTALFLDVVYWALLYNPQDDELDLPNLASHAFNLACVLFEMILSLRMNFKLLYILFAALYVAIYLGFMWIRYAITNEFTYEIYDFRGKSGSAVAVYYSASLAWALLSGFIMVLVSRLNRLPCVPQIGAQRHSDIDEQPQHDVENGRPFDNRI